MNIKEVYPKLFKKIADDDLVEDLYDLVSIDANYVDEDALEDDIFDPEDYNYILYIDERLQNAIGEENFKLLRKKIENMGVIEDFICSEDDLYGIRSNLQADEITKNILDIVENELLMND